MKKSTTKRSRTNISELIKLDTPFVPKYKITLVNLGRLRKTIKLHDLPKIPSIIQL